MRVEARRSNEASVPVGRAADLGNEDVEWHTKASTAAWTREEPRRHLGVFTRWLIGRARPVLGSLS